MVEDGTKGNSRWLDRWKVCKVKAVSTPLGMMTLPSKPIGRMGWDGWELTYSEELPL